jgi:hypothetical protein
MKKEYYREWGSGVDGAGGARSTAHDVIDSQIF